MSRMADEEHLLDGVAIALDLAVNDGVERRLLRHRPKPLRDKELFLEDLPARFPGRFRGGRRPGMVRQVVVLRLLGQPLVLFLAAKGGRGERDDEYCKERAGHALFPSPTMSAAL